MKRSIIIQAIPVLTLLMLSGCGTRGSSPEASSQTVTSQNAPQAPEAPALPSKPVAPKRAQQDRPKHAVTQPPSGPKQPAATPPSSQPQQVVPVPKPVVVNAGTVIDVTVDQLLSSKTNKPGDKFDASVASPVVVADSVIIPTGAKVSGTVTAAESAGKMTGNASLGLRLDSVTVNGMTYNVKTSAFEKAGEGRGKRTGIGAAIGGAAGAIIGAITGGKKGAAIGAGAGAGAGTVGAVLTGNRDIEIAAETELKFTLSQDITINRQID
jgi:hypothetical protein